MYLTYGAKLWKSMGNLNWLHWIFQKPLISDGTLLFLENFHHMASMKNYACGSQIILKTANYLLLLMAFSPQPTTLMQECLKVLCLHQPSFYFLRIIYSRSQKMPRIALPMTVPCTHPTVPKIPQQLNKHKLLAKSKRTCFQVT